MEFKVSVRTESEHVCCVCLLSCFSRVLCDLFVTPWTVAHQAALSMGFSRQEHWKGLPRPPPGDSSWPRNRIVVSCVFCIAGGFFITKVPENPSKCWDAPYLILLVPHYNLREEVLSPSFNSG